MPKVKNIATAVIASLSNKALTIIAMAKTMPISVITKHNVVTYILLLFHNNRHWFT